ncbi:MAG: bifunctional nuclease family protein [Planctomycetota bacterium]|nr:bifunctional nuclease family protein [Planctomycetota bacterium]
MELVKVVIHEHNEQQMIHLQEKDGERGFPIMIGMSEAAEIHRKLTGFKPMRPLTHDLLANVIESTGSGIERVVISDLRAGTFYATIHLRQPTGDVEGVDARPSDAIALAVQLEAPIFVDEAVFGQLS